MANHHPEGQIPGGFLERERDSRGNQALSGLEVLCRDNVCPEISDLLAGTLNVVDAKNLRLTNTEFAASCSVPSQLVLNTMLQQKVWANIRCVICGGRPEHGIHIYQCAGVDGPCSKTPYLACRQCYLSVRPRSLRATFGRLLQVRQPRPLWSCYSCTNKLKNVRTFAKADTCHCTKALKALTVPFDKIHCQSCFTKGGHKLVGSREAFQAIVEQNKARLGWYRGLSHHSEGGMTLPCVNCGTEELVSEQHLKG